MKRIFSAFALLLALCGSFSIGVQAQELLIPAGNIIGLRISDDTVTVAAFDDVLGQNAREAGLQIGDALLEIQGQPIRRVQDVRRILQDSPGEIHMTVSRGSKRRSVHMDPAKSSDGARLGVYLKQGVSGIGTVTWYDPATNRFGTLGHGVNDRKGLLTAMKEGTVYPASITAVVPGKAGQPGYLRGNADSAQCMGTVLRNTPQGVFGKSPQGWTGEPLPTALYGQIHTGPAAIRSTVSGTQPREYDVEILKIYPVDRRDSRNFLLKVTDPALLSTTGGIVQGMSGSPILQDGRIIGAVTHVMVSDPTTGYGIFIGNMLDAAA